MTEIIDKNGINIDLRPYHFEVICHSKMWLISFSKMTLFNDKDQINEFGREFVTPFPFSLTYRIAIDKNNYKKVNLNNFRQIKRGKYIGKCYVNQVEIPNDQNYRAHKF